MATTSKQLFLGAATTNTATTLYTTPASTTTVLTHIIVFSSTTATFKLSLGGVVLHNDTPILAGVALNIDCKQVLVATNTITGGASSTNVQFSLSGVQIT